MSAIKRWLEEHCIECGQELNDDDLRVDDGLIRYCSDECFSKRLAKMPEMSDAEVDAELTY